MANLEMMKKNAIDKAAEYAQAYNQHETPVKTLRDMKKVVKGAVDSYNQALAQETYRKWKSEGEPVKTAIRSRVIPHAIKISLKPNDNDYVVVKESEDENYEVNLPLMQATIGADQFSNPGWFPMLQKLAYLVAKRINNRMGSGVRKFDYQIEAAAKAFQFPEGMDPLSDEGIIKALQMVFDAILFLEDPDVPGENMIKTRKLDDEGTPYSVEWTVIRESMTKEAGVNTQALFKCSFLSSAMCPSPFQTRKVAPFPKRP